MACPICQRRKAKRFCPAKGATICAVCCGTEREVTIDCPSDCSYLKESRRQEARRREIDWAKMPFRDTKIPSSFVAAHEKLLLALSYSICLAARDNPQLVDTDASAALELLAETYRTLSSGIYYEKPPAYPLQRTLYDVLKAAIEDYKKREAQETSLGATRNGEIRDALIFLAQLGATRANGRPKGRAYLDFLRTQFKSEELTRPASNIVLLP